jgi:hypothetical protein
MINLYVPFFKQPYRFPQIKAPLALDLLRFLTVYESGYFPDPVAKYQRGNILSSVSSNLFNLSTTPSDSCLSYSNNAQGGTWTGQLHPPYIFSRTFPRLITWYTAPSYSIRNGLAIQSPLYYILNSCLLSLELFKKQDLTPHAPLWGSRRSNVTLFSISPLIMLTTGKWSVCLIGLSNVIST